MKNLHMFFYCQTCKIKNTMWDGRCGGSLIALQSMLRQCSWFRIRHLTQWKTLRTDRITVYCIYGKNSDIQRKTKSIVLVYKNLKTTKNIWKRTISKFCEVTLNWWRFSIGLKLPLNLDAEKFRNRLASSYFCKSVLLYGHCLHTETVNNILYLLGSAQVGVAMTYVQCTPPQYTHMSSYLSHKLVNTTGMLSIQ